MLSVEANRREGGQNAPRKFLKPTVRITRREGRLPDVLLSMLDTRESQPGTGIDQVLIKVLGCDASPVWVSVASLRPLISTAEVM